MRFLPVSLSSFLVELQTLNETLALFNTLQGQTLTGIREMIPAARTILIHFSPYETSASALATEISQLHLDQPFNLVGRQVEIPVDYNGEDLPAVADYTGLTIAQVIQRHTAPDYLVAFCGFAPGFGYLTGSDPALHVPRRQTPRTQIPAGSVGLAGEFTGVYPQASPGGWQLIGTTSVKMWSPDRAPPAFFQPGDHVRFIDRAGSKRDFFTPGPLPRPTSTTPQAGQATALMVLAAPLPALFQDLGRAGQTSHGVSSSGALDRGALKAANRLVGNPEDEPCLELAGGGFSFRSTGRAVIGLTGAPCTVTLRTATGRALASAFYKPISLDTDDVVTFSPPLAGTRSYMSVRGGFVVEKPLGSAATDILAGLGPAPVGAGDQLMVKPPAGLQPVLLAEPPALRFPAEGEIVWLDIVLGPRTDWFTPQSLITLIETEWEVTVQSNRVGARLNSPASLIRANTKELPSEACVAGALEVPPDGKPLLLLADHPLTGGYPVIAAVADYHLDLAGQTPVGAKIRFRPLALFSVITCKKDGYEENSHRQSW